MTAPSPLWCSLKAMPSIDGRSSFARVALLYRRPPQIVAVELEQVESTEDHIVTAPAPQQIEDRKPVGVADDGLAVDHTGPHRQLTEGRRRQRERSAKS
jgi:hypothetical protein